MDLEEVREHRRLLEDNITNYLMVVLKDFEKITGFSVHDIECSFVEVTSFEDRHPRYTLSTVFVKLEDI